ncbi:hypothetical protein FE257_006889 [Aspergillus nanangensis]|uniref:Peptidase M20 dimerisation domain-containing protein n=1 Tax=Aspergillus nanangensis TaxID=2582783 RepID=A0AAD4GTQ2_ASPNN|nr:hypothetical protein FE257_006889 [Aspergillus nanangensis]
MRHPILVPLLSLLPSVSALTIPSLQFPLISSSNNNQACPLPAKIHPEDDGLHPALNFVQDPRIRTQQVNRLSRAVQVPTTVSDYVTDPYDEAFAPFLTFHTLLEELFPITHQKSTLTKLNRLALLYTLPGTNPSLKPLLFTAHQDVVPIVNASDWSHPPFAGHFDGTWLWGRGASDCKNVLIGLLSVIEDLLAQDWTPTRTVILAFGFDEESHGFLGAGHIAPYLEEVYGAGGVEFVLDEGGMGEKGSLDLTLTLTTRGGHSSIPPPHTGIGIIAEIIHTLETALPFTPVLDATHPARKKLQCQVAHSPVHVEDWLPAALADTDYAALAERVAASRGEAVRFTLQTSQAADLIHGGVKSNALPETVFALVNYRVALHQTPEEVLERARGLIAPIVEKYDVGLVVVGDDGDEEGEEGEGGFGRLVLSTLAEPLRPAPVSPTHEESAVWMRFAGVTRDVFESVPSLKGKTVVVAGDIMTGNTDTRFYWNLSENIYRWSPSRVGGALNIHTVDERLAIDVHLEAMMLYYDLIRAFDGDHTVEPAHDL